MAVAFRTVLDASSYRLDTAIRPDSGEPRLVVVDADGFLHPEATAWLQFLTDVGRSPNTVRGYGRRVVWYLSWCALTMDWRRATLSHLALCTPHCRCLTCVENQRQQRLSQRRHSRVVDGRGSIIYEWADAHSLLVTDVVSRMTELKS